MQTSKLKSNAVFWLIVLLTAATAVFIVISVLKYGLHSPLLFDAVAPYLNRSGVQQPFEFNINAFLATTGTPF